MICPRCGSEDTAPAEQEYSSDYPFWVAIAVVFLLIAGAFLLFLFLQLHPIILILMAVAAASWLLDAGSQRKKKRRKKEYICLSCDHRFKI